MKAIILSFFLIGTTISCNLLEEEPEVFISPDNFFSTEEEALAAVVGIYDRLQPIYPDMIVLADISADGVSVEPGVSATQEVFDLNQVTSKNAILTDFWNNSYQGINRANTVVDRLTQQPSQDAYQGEFIAEAKFLRALFYFNLVRLFGDVPLVVNESLSIDNLVVPRDPVSTVYQQIITDLQDASNLLPLTAPAPGRATQGAAQALLAKVHLTLEDFTSAQTLLQQIVDAGTYQLLDRYADVFSVAEENGDEAIFSVQYLTGQGEGHGINIQSLPRELNDVIIASPVFNTFNASQKLVDAYAEGDLRANTNAVTTYEVDTVVVEFAPAFFKYSDGVFTNQGSGTENSRDSGSNFPILRYADVLLMLAEADNEVNSVSSTALDAINQVRRRAFGLPINASSEVDITNADQTQLREEIQEERFRELPSEGHRWFDLKRTNRLMEVVGIPEFRTVYPIPEPELRVNNKLEQNDGYEN